MGGQRIEYGTQQVIIDFMDFVGRAEWAAPALPRVGNRPHVYRGLPGPNDAANVFVLPKTPQAESSANLPRGNKSHRFLAVNHWHFCELEVVRICLDVDTVRVASLSLDISQLLTPFSGFPRYFAATKANQ